MICATIYWHAACYQHCIVYSASVWPSGQLTCYVWSYVGMFLRLSNVTCQRMACTGQKGIYQKWHETGLHVQGPFVAAWPNIWTEQGSWHLALDGGRTCLSRNVPRCLHGNLNIIPQCECNSLITSWITKKQFCFSNLGILLFCFTENAAFIMFSAKSDCMVGRSLLPSYSIHGLANSCSMRSMLLLAICAQGLS